MAVGGDGNLTLTYDKMEINGETVSILYDKRKTLYICRADVNRIFEGHFEHYTNAFFNVDHSTVKGMKDSLVSIISAKDLIEIADDLYLDVLDGIKNNYKGLARRLRTLTSYVLCIQDEFRKNNWPKQHFTDRKLCARCKYSYFDKAGGSKENKFRWCNYYEYTRRNRPHCGSECYGFEEK